MVVSSVRRSGVVVLLAAVIGGGMAIGQGTTQPAATLPASRPATRTAEAGAGQTVAVARGSIDLRLDLDGVFAPLDPVEIGTRTKAYQGEFTILEVAEPGPVKQGDVLLRIEPKLLQRQIAQAEADLKNARAHADKAKADFALAVNGDALELKRARDTLRHAEEAARWFADNDSKMMSAMATMQDKISSFQTESAEDELDQLKKMYKSDDLTNETADIVMKRAVRILDIYRVMSEVYGLQTKKLREYMIDFNRQELATRVEQAKHALAQLEVNQEAAKVTRQTGLDAATMAVSAAEDRLADLKNDLAVFEVKAPADGVLMYGAFKNKAWQPTPPETLRAGEKIPPGQVVLTLVQPGRLRVVSEVPESKLSLLTPGKPGRITPAADPGRSYPLTVRRVESLGAAKGDWQAFDVWFDLAETAGQLLPGFRGHIVLPGEKVEGVLVVPASAVWKGRVWVRSADGKDEPRDVTVGRSDANHVEIIAGLKEGEKVLKQAKK